MQTLIVLGEEEARIALESIRARLADRGQSAVIVVSDAAGEAIALLRMDGAPVSSVVVAINKAFTAARLRRPSGLIGMNARHPETGFEISYYGDPRYVGWGGGVPVIIDGTVAGAIAVSGLSSSEDEELARIGIAAIMAHLDRAV